MRVEITRKLARGLGSVALAAFLIAAWYASLQWFAGDKADMAQPVSAQTDMMLERRISQVEQRFYYIESRLNQIENQSRYPGVLPGASSPNPIQLGQLQTEIDTLRTQIDQLRSRVGEVECGVLKLDERTLTPAARQDRRQAAAGTREPCRMDERSPIRLSSRP